MIKKLVIFGVGLIGGSLALALKQANYCQNIVGCGRNAENLQKAVDLGVIDSYTLDTQTAVQNADMVLLVVPMGAMQALLESIKPALPAEAVLTVQAALKAVSWQKWNRFSVKITAVLFPVIRLLGAKNRGLKPQLPIYT